MNNNTFANQTLSSFNFPVSKASGSIYLALALLGLAGNVLVFPPIFKDQQLINLAPYQLMAGLAIFDISYHIAMVYFAWLSITADLDYSYDVSSAFGFLAVFGWLGAIWMMFFLGLNRFVCVCRPHQLQNYFSLNKTRAYIVWSFIATFAENVMVILPNTSRFFYDVTLCSFGYDPARPFFDDMIIFAQFLNIASCAGLPFFYIPILFTLRKVRKNLGRSTISRQEIKITIQFFIQYIIYAFNALSFVPVQLRLIPGDQFVVACYAKLFWALTPTLDPWIYLAINSKVRKATWKFWGCIKANHIIPSSHTGHQTSAKASASALSVPVAPNTKRNELNAPP